MVCRAKRVPDRPAGRFRQGLAAPRRARPLAQRHQSGAPYTFVPHRVARSRQSAAGSRRRRAAMPAGAPTGRWPSWELSCLVVARHRRGSAARPPLRGSMQSRSRGAEVWRVSMRWPGPAPSGGARRRIGGRDRRQRRRGPAAPRRGGGIGTSRAMLSAARPRRRGRPLPWRHRPPGRSQLVAGRGWSGSVPTSRATRDRPPPASVSRAAPSPVRAPALPPAPRVVRTVQRCLRDQLVAPGSAGDLGWQPAAVRRSRTFVL